MTIPRAEKSKKGGLNRSASEYKEGTGKTLDAMSEGEILGRRETGKRSREILQSSNS